MNRRVIISASLIAAAILLPELGFAEDIFDKAEIKTEVTNLVDSLFGYPTKIAGVLAGSYGLLQSFFAASPKPMMLWGGISLISFFIKPALSVLFGI